jgi:hypothetical protein
MAKRDVTKEDKPNETAQQGGFLLAHWCEETK